jgi:short-subunit dehydrogenase
MSNKNSSPAPLALVTGASSGIGASAAAVFAGAGYNVVIAARRIDRLNELAALLKSKYPDRSIVPIECDVCSDVSVLKLFQRITEEFGFLTVLVNNAGYGVYGSVEETSISAFQQNMDTNYLGSIRCIHGALPLLRKAALASNNRIGASVVMVSSIVGRRAMPQLASYSATKFAMEALSESLRVELHDEKISVSVVNPGVTRTEFGDSARGSRPNGFLSFEHGMSSDEVAEVILKAARNGGRNYYLTAAGKAGVFFEWLSPRFLDFVLLRTWRKVKKS